MEPAAILRVFYQKNIGLSIMSLQPTIEPPGALQTGWKLVSKGQSPDSHNIEAVPEQKPVPPGPHGDSSPDPRSAWEVGEIG